MENIQAQMKELFGNSCLGYCYGYIAYKHTLEIEPSIKLLTMTFLDGWVNGWVNDSGKVEKPVQYYNSINKASQIRDVRKVPIHNLNELPATGMFAVEFKVSPEHKESHFAVCIKGKIIFDPSGDSITCRYGAPVAYRELIYA